MPPPAHRHRAAQAVGEALALHQQGRLADAEKSYRQVLARDPRNFDGLHLLGVLKLQSGDPAEALRLIGRALQVNARSADALSNYAAVLAALDRWTEALASYEKALAIDPHHLDALYNRGHALQQAGRLADAISCYDKVLARQPGHANALNNRGVALYRSGRPDEALASFDRALALAPNFADALRNRGDLLQELGRSEEALVSLERALAIDPDHVGALNNRGLALHRLGRHADALRSFDAALALSPDNVDVLGNRAVVLQGLGRSEEALAVLDRALACSPARAGLLNNRGAALVRLGRASEALSCFEQALAVEPEDVDALTHRGDLLQQLDREAEALAVLDQAIALAPACADAHNVRGSTLVRLGRHGEAIESFARALELVPAFADAHLNCALAHLALGQFREGWPHYEWRSRVKHLAGLERNFTAPRWSGAQPPAGTTILLHAEQGLGDTLQFVRYAPLVARHGARVVLEVQPALKSLLAGMAGVAEVIARGEELPTFDLHCPLLSLPLAFGTEIATIPAETPYVFAPPDRTARWRERLAGAPSPRVGLAWSGNPNHTEDRNRSIPLARLAPLVHAQQATFFGLQKDRRPADREMLAQIPITDLADSLVDFAETAAVIAELDLVISVDTAVAHLAGAMGKPVWILLPHYADFRWLLNHEDTPWYPTARLFRQPLPGDWECVLGQVHDALVSMAA
ncbi:MAG TPA: tetratricopeptide repeat protein [Xanthobacteraceae bacterium]|nr:tetratricopeptide repeat protein [Xanthobacteraceae bacterium]